MQQASPPAAGYGGPGTYPSNSSCGPPMPAHQQQGSSPKQIFPQSQGQGDQLTSHMGGLQIGGGQQMGPPVGAAQINGINHGPQKTLQQYPNGQPGYPSLIGPSAQHHYCPPQSQQGLSPIVQAGSTNGMTHNRQSIEPQDTPPANPMGSMPSQMTGPPPSMGNVLTSMGSTQSNGPHQIGLVQADRPSMGLSHSGALLISPSQASGPPVGPPQLATPSMGQPQPRGPATGLIQTGASSMGPSQARALPPTGLTQSGGPPPMGPSQSSGAPQMASTNSLSCGPPMGGSGGQQSGNYPAAGPPTLGPPMMGGPPGGGPTPAGRPPHSGPSMGTPGGMPPGNAPPMGASNGGPGNPSVGPSMHQGPQNSMIPPMGGLPQNPPIQNGVQNGPNSAFQAPPLGGFQNQQQGYSIGSPASGGSYATNQPPQIGQGFVQPPPPMYGQPNGQYPQQAVQQQPYTGQAQQLGRPAYPGPPPGAYPQGGYPGGQQRPNMQAPPQQRKLDPDQMPSPVQVIEDDRKNHLPGPFGTSKLGELPPLVTTDVEIQDEGNAAPNYIRSTIYAVPCSPDVTKQTQVPLALAIMPFARHPRADAALPVSVFNDEIVRCNRCKAYMCSFMQFLDGGRRFQCVFCKATTEVPQGYFNHLDHTGQRVDKWQRAELCLGSYEILATKEYCKNNVFPKPPAFIFILDVSYNAIKCGMVQLFCHHFKDILQDLPTDEGSQEETGIRVGFITYSSQVHFYNIDKRLSQPQMMVVPDVADMFVPFLEGCLVKPSEAMHVIESLGQEIPRIFAGTRETETILGPAIQAGLEALKAAECAGKLFVFHTTLPTAEAPGKLKNRDDRKVLGTEKEKTVLTPGCPYYQELATQCVSAGCSVDLFIAPNSFVDLASIGQVAKITGGQVYKYTYFQSGVDGERFLADLRRTVSKPIAFDAVMRVRTSTGIRPTDFYGNVYMQNTTDVELASIDCDKCVTVELKYDDKLPENECAFVQVALLYTSVCGQRKLRLHNLCLNTTQQMTDMFRNCELDVIMNLFCKQALRQVLDASPKSMREAVTLRAATMLASYRKHCATASSSGQLILPECMKLLPLYVNCMMKCDALSGGPEITVDDRSFGMVSLNSMDVKASQAYLYPRLLPIHDLDPAEEADTIPVAMRASVEKLRDDGAYILENGMFMFLFIGLQVDPAWCEAVFAVPNAARIDIEQGFPRLNTPASLRLQRLVDNLRADRSRFMRICIVRQGDKLELVLRQFLVEDRMSDSQLSYVDYLCQLHRDIRNLIS